jgi:hypothetical protein
MTMERKMGRLQILLSRLLSPFLLSPFLLSPFLLSSVLDTDQVEVKQYGKSVTSIMLSLI